LFCKNSFLLYGVYIGGDASEPEESPEEAAPETIIRGADCWKRWGKRRDSRGAQAKGSTSHRPE
jgi:hypothetical protein